MQLDRLAMEDRVLGSSESISPGPAFMSVGGKHAGTTCGQRPGADLEDLLVDIWLDKNLIYKQ